jgi:DNA-binding beta-propeller fold protein YncE
MTTNHITTALALAVSAFALATADSAFAVGQISYDGCASIDGSGARCAPTSGALAGADSVAVSPDDGSVYATGLSGSGVSVFRRAPHGQITFDGCVSDDGSAGKCADLPGAPLNHPSAVTISPDGKQLYVAGDRVVTVLDRASGGQLTYAGCVSNDGSAGACADVPGAPLTSSRALAMSPDGGSLYVAGTAANTLAVFNRASGGQITYAGCVSEDGSGGLCGTTSAASLKGLNSLAVSPDGKSVYASSDVRAALTAFDRAPSGQITFAGCVSDNSTGVGQCADVPGQPLNGANSVSMSPDGKTLYATALDSDAVSVYDRAADGKLAYAGCVSANGSGGLCADAPGIMLDGASASAVSPDGATVYVTAQNTRSINVLDRAPGGQITFAGCVSEDGSGGLCADAPGPLEVPRAIAISPDAGSVYTAASPSSNVTHLFRKTFPDTTIDAGPANGSKNASARPRFAFSSNQAGASFECSLDGAAFAACKSPATFGPLGKGSHRLAVRAIAVGDADPTPATRSFSVGPTGPRVRITRAPKRKIATKARKVSVTFAFRSPDRAARFSCKLDRRPAKSCKKRVSYRLGRGKHKFTVAALDALGNRGPAASRSVQVIKK